MIPAERLRAMVRLLGPQEMTPTAKRQLEALCDEDETYVVELEDACLYLWGELPIPETTRLVKEMPRLAEFLRHLHDTVEHGDGPLVTRTDSWAEPVDG